MGRRTAGERGPDEFAGGPWTGGRVEISFVEARGEREVRQVNLVIPEREGGEAVVEVRMGTAGADCRIRVIGVAD